MSLAWDEEKVFKKSSFDVIIQCLKSVQLFMISLLFFFFFNQATAAGGLKLHGTMYLKYGCMILLCVNHAAAAFDIQDTTKAVTARA